MVQVHFVKIKWHNGFGLGRVHEQFISEKKSRTFHEFTVIEQFMNFSILKVIEQFMNFSILKVHELFRNLYQFMN